MAAKPRSSAPAPAGDAITFERKPAPIAVFFLAVPALILLLIVFNVATNRFPITLLALFSAVGATCLFWIKVAIDQVGNVVLELGPQDLRVKHIVGGSTYAWNDIEAIKLFDPGPSLSDSGRSEGGRIGIGLYLRTTNKQKRAADAPPDAVIITSTQEGAAAVIAASERLIAIHRKGGNVKASGGNTGAFGKQGRAFRRPAKAAAAA